MKFEIIEEPITALAEHACIPIKFVVRSVFDLTEEPDTGPGMRMKERALESPYVKDYDAIKGEGPTRWAKRFDVTNWGLISAWLGGTRVGGTVIARDTPGVDLLEGRHDLAVLWDLRVATDCRGQGVGSALFRAAEEWGAARGCRQLKVETQNINVPACRFYQRMGCKLGAANRGAYPEFPDEVQLLWYKYSP
ncbi:MAG: GNAT family N-acetyltransferase [Opitutaceae bacterium]|nr:GNAT family N-acetyltransferase [Opitutaceae bacterium]